MISKMPHCVYLVCAEQLNRSVSFAVENSAKCAEVKGLNGFDITNICDGDNL